MFYAVSKHGGKFKALFEVIFQNMTTACFTIDKKGMFMENRTTQNILFTIFLPASSFQEYVYDFDEPKYIGLNSHINKEFFKHIKHKDVFSMKMSKPFIFDFEKNTEDNVKLILSVSIENIQNIKPMNLLVYTTPSIPLSSANFNQICRSFNSIPVISLTKCTGQLTFSFETGITTKTMVFGKEQPIESDMIHFMYYADQFVRINKISSFVTDPIEVRMEANKPLYFYCNSVVGLMKIFIYPKIDN